MKSRARKSSIKLFQRGNLDYLDGRAHMLYKENFPRHRQASKGVNTNSTVDQRYLLTAFWEWRQQMPFVPTLSESFVHMQKRTRSSRIPRRQCRRNTVRLGRLERGRLSEDQLCQWSHYQDRIPKELIYEITE